MSNQPSAIVAATVNCKTMADDTLRLTVDIEPDDAQQAFQMFGKRGSTVAIARLTDEAAKADMQAKAAGTKGPYSKHAQLLHQSGFFNDPKVQQDVRECWIHSSNTATPLDIDANGDWAWSALKELFGYEHWYDVPPQTLYEWAEERGIEWKLPAAYRKPSTVAA